MLLECEIRVYCSQNEKLLIVLQTSRLTNLVRPILYSTLVSWDFIIQLRISMLALPPVWYETSLAKPDRFFTYTR